MVQQLTFAINEACFKWKSDSLEIMIIGECANDNPFRVLSVGAGDFEMFYKPIQEMWLLGSLLDARGRTFVSVSARFRVASKHYFRNLQLWNRMGNERMKVTKWVEVFHGCMMHGARNWHITA